MAAIMGGLAIDLAYKTELPGYRFAAQGLGVGGSCLLAEIVQRV